jgi:hypothetical protein
MGDSVASDKLAVYGSRHGGATSNTRPDIAQTIHRGHLAIAYDVSMTVGLELECPPSGVTLEVFDAEPVGDLELWRSRVFARTDGDRTAVVHGHGTLETNAGWPMLVVRSELDGVQRVHALFVIDDHGVAVVLQGAVDEHREALLALLQGARPTFPQSIVALTQIWNVA